MPTAKEITTFDDTVPTTSIWVTEAPPAEVIVIAEHDPGWLSLFERLADDLRRALGTKALSLEHVGSTSVPDLAAKPIIDIDLTVAEPRDEDAYVLALAPLGYRHTVREPTWYEHRMLQLDEPRVHLHVWGPGCPEAVRHRLFRDWLSAHPDDRRAYEAAKRAAVPGGGDMMAYNRRKEPVLREIYARIFAAAGLTP
ncbi:MAG: GrpB family protein [Mycobacteriales bacterium]